MVRPATRRWVRAAASGVGATVLVSIVLAAGPRQAGQAPPAQSPAAPPDQPTFRLGANYVRVDVYPSRGGEPVQDLGRADFELLEDGVPQNIEQFERISLQTAIDPDARRDPNTVAESREQAGDPRRRVFVVFLDTGMTTLEGSHSARKPIIDMLDKLIGYDDLFAVMTPDMRGSDVTFARRTGGLDAELAKYWTWGQRDAMSRTDPEELEIETCFPDPAPEQYCMRNGKLVKQPADAYRGVAIQLIERRAEKRALGALDDLVSFLATVREERKAVIVVSQGWRLLEPKSQLTKMQECDVAPGPGTPGVSPGGRLVPDVGSTRDAGSTYAGQCAAMAMEYALADNNQSFHQLIERANRFNVSFYPFDTRGLAAFDQSIGARDDRIRNDPGERSEAKRPSQGGPLGRDMGRLQDRLQSLQTLAEATDGLAVVNTNNLAGGARRIVNDLSTYYLLGYQSTNTQLDGKWRNITVRIKAPGIQVRARRGYRALTEKEVSILSGGGSTSGAAGGSANPAGPGVDTAAAALSRAIAPLAGLERALPWHSRAGWGYAGAGDPGVRFWVASEIDDATMQRSEWAGGGTWTATLTGADGTRIAETSAPLAAGARSVEASLAADIPDRTEVMIRLRLSPAGGGLPLSDALRVTPSGTSARLFRSGLTTGRRFVVAGDARFRRSDRARVLVPVADAAIATEAVLLDRTGTALKLPVTSRVETIDGAAWAVGELALAPLSPGDYAIRVVAGQGDRALTSLTGIKIVN